MYTIDLADCREGDLHRVGGKAIGLGKLIQSGFPVPAGFCVTVDAYAQCCRGLLPQIQAELDYAAGRIDETKVSKRIQALFVEELMTSAVATAVDDALAHLCDGVVGPVAVRSSATAEDLAGASFAGQQDTYLWIHGASQVRRHIVLCWASLFTARAITYRKHIDLPPGELGMGVVVQRMVPAEAAGVMMTLHPVTGDRSINYIESAFGLGEIVVRGEVDADRFEITKSPNELCQITVGTKQNQYLFDDVSNSVRLLPVPEEQQSSASLSPSEALQLSSLGNDIEVVFSRPMDIEWAVATNSSSGAREFFLLQARPETVWAERESVETLEDVIRSDETWDVIRGRRDARGLWTTSNTGEAAPGVLTPLCWSIWGYSAEFALREAAYQIGLLTSSERLLPDNSERRFVQIFFGRVALRADFFALLGDRMLGTTGAESVEGIFGRSADDLVYEPTRKFYPRIAFSMTKSAFNFPRRLRRFAKEYEKWWHDCIDRIGSLDLNSAKQQFVAAQDRFNQALVMQNIVLMVVVQPLYSIATKLARAAGIEPDRLAGVSGNAEMAVVHDLWCASRNQMDIEEVVRRHGFHGPLEGELSSRVWREDPSPLYRMVEQYARRDQAHDPRTREQSQMAQRHEAEREVIAALPWLARPLVRIALWLVKNLLPLRGVAKGSFLQAFDVLRATARHIGTLHVAAGEMDTPDDVFYLTAEEILQQWPSEVRTLVANRKRRRVTYQQVQVPERWVGSPVATSVKSAEQQSHDSNLLTGIGVSAGVVEGSVRVVLNPDFAEVQPDEILVAPSTDPSWSSIMFISSAVIVDIGGALSHAAVVAREMRVPCVVNTGVGTRFLRTGDRVRVDGTAGTVELLERADFTAEKSSLVEKTPIL